MAFPIPDHLPRRSKPQDVSSEILSRIDNATYRTLNVQLASSWVNDLDDSIRSIKTQLHERIQANLPEFQRQSDACKSVRSRLETLTTSASKLEGDVLDPETGLIPTVASALADHNALAQQATNAQTKFDALSHLLKCRKEFDDLQGLVQAGKLPHVVGASITMSQLIDEAPAALMNATVMTDLKQRFRVLKAFAEEQLNEAWSRGVVIGPSRIAISSTIQVRKSDTVLSLADILRSMPATSLSDQLTTLRRNLVAHFIDVILTQPAFISITFSMTEHSLAIIPSPPNNEVLSQRVDNLAQLFDFLLSDIAPAIPATPRSEFLRALSRPITTSILNSILIPSLPSSLDKLPHFLQLLQHAVTFEEQYLVGLFGGESRDRPIDNWGKGVCGHYERQRRSQILDHTRKVTLDEDRFLVRIPIEVEVLAEGSRVDVIPVQEEEQVNEVAGVSDDAWGFEEDSPATGDAVEVEDSWGFDDGLEAEPDSKTGVKLDGSKQQPASGNGLKSETTDIDVEPDPADAWGWDDNEDIPAEDQVSEETAWDDPWADPSDSKATADSPQAEQRTLISPKAATKLEKLASKNKKHINGTASASVLKDNSTSPDPVNTPSPLHHSEPIKKTLVSKRPSNLTTVPKEIYVISGNTMDILNVAKNVITEGKEFQTSKLLSTTNAGSVPGAILLQTASAVLDLYRALFPVRFSSQLQSTEGAFVFSNNCCYLCTELDKFELDTTSADCIRVKENLSECQRLFKVLADSWFHDTVEREQRIVDKMLTDGTQGFTYTGDQDRYDECENTIGEVLRHIRQLAPKLKGVLTKGKYYTVLGQVTNAALSRILNDIIALPDIPELESHKLSDLSKILNAVEGLFSEDPSQPSFVVAYVPSWLKYSYLSELLEASMADITYLFEEGALVDFEVDELVKLVRALFADTPLRTNTINKILGGHPQS